MTEQTDQVSEVDMLRLLCAVERVGRLQATAQVVARELAEAKREADAARQRIVGAYRLGAGDEIAPNGRIMRQGNGQGDGGSDARIHPDAE